MLDTHRIESRIKEIRKRIILLSEEFGQIDEEEFVKNDHLNAEVERHLQVAIQSCIDIANHIVASLGLNRDFESLGEVFYELAKKNIIPEISVNTMINITGYRNILVHGYLEVQREITYDIVKNHLSDLSLFVFHIDKFLDRR